MEFHVFTTEESLFKYIHLKMKNMILYCAFCYYFFLIVNIYYLIPLMSVVRSHINSYEC